LRKPGTGHLPPADGQAHLGEPGREEVGQTSFTVEAGISGIAQLMK
jgi:hypothetical protein